MASSSAVQARNADREDGRYLYRTMEKDLRDLTWNCPTKGPGALFFKGQRVDRTELTKNHPIMRQLAVHCIDNRQTWNRSILMPSCNDFINCRVWWGQADANIRQNRGYLVRMKRSKIGEANLIDLSSQEAQKVFFEDTYDNAAKWGDYVANEAGPLLKRCLLYTSPSPRDS